MGADAKPCARDPVRAIAALREGLEEGRIEALTYKHRLDTHDDGPHGHLVRDVLLDRAYRSSQFVRLPEIVEDICLAARNEFHVDLKSRFDAATTSCVVEFATKPRDVREALTSARGTPRLLCARSRRPG